MPSGSSLLWLLRILAFFAHVLFLRLFPEWLGLIENNEAVIINPNHNHGVPDIKEFEFRTSLRAAAILAMQICVRNSNDFIMQV